MQSFSTKPPRSQASLVTSSGVVPYKRRKVAAPRRHPKANRSQEARLLFDNALKINPLQKEESKTSVQKEKAQG